MIKLPMKRITCVTTVGIVSKKTRTKAGRLVKRLLYQSRRETTGVLDQRGRSGKNWLNSGCMFR